MGKATRLGGAGTVGPPGPPGGGGTPAPAAISATGSIVNYQQWANATQPVFDGVITLDTGNADYSHDKRFIVEAIAPGGATTILLDNCTFDAPFSGSTITYSGSTSSILQTDAVQSGWGLKVTPYNEYNEPGTPTLIPSDYPTHSLTIAAAEILALSAIDDTEDRWNDGPNGNGGAVHAVIPVTVSCSNYPQTVTIATKSPQYGLLVHGWFSIFASFENVVNIGAQAGSALASPGVPTTIFPPTAADETVTVYAAVGVNLTGDPTTWPGVASTTLVVSAPLAPSAMAATGAWIDEILDYPTSGTWGWNNMYATLPFGDPNFIGARWTVQNGHYATPGDPSTFVAGDPTTAQHGGLEVAFTDYDANTVLRQPDTNIVSVQNNNPSALWGIPDYILTGGAVNPDNVFRIRNMIASPLESGPGDPATWTYQNDWSSGVGDSTPGTYAYQDIVFDLSKGTVNAANLDPASLGNGVGVAHGKLAAKLSPLGGLVFDSSGNTQANLGYTMQINPGGQIVLSNLPVSYGLPSVPSAAYPAGSVILNSADDKVYRNPTGGAWVKSSDPADLVTGAIATGVTIAAAAIAAGTLAVGVEYAGTITASQVTSGNFTGVTMTLVLNGVTTLLNNTSYGIGYASLVSESGTGSSQLLTAVYPQGIASFYGGINKATLITGTGGGQLNLFNATGSKQVVLDYSALVLPDGALVVIGGYPILSSRVLITPATLGDVISVLQHHGLSN